MAENPFAAPASDDDARHSVEDGGCPLCGDVKRMRKPLPLYGHKVCSKCVYSFTNRRQFAYVIDVLPLLAINFGMQAVGRALVASSPDQATTFALVTLIVSTIVTLLFYMKDGFGGKSIGKMICGVTVIDRDSGKPIGFFTSLKRWLPFLIIMIVLNLLSALVVVGVIDQVVGGVIILGLSVVAGFMVLAIGVIMAKGPRWGDGIANTKVIWDKYAGNPVFTPSTGRLSLEDE